MAASAHAAEAAPVAVARGPDLLTPLLADLAATSPQQAGVLATCVRDLALAVEWCELRPTTLPGTDWVVVIGRKRRSDPLRAVLPLPLHTTALTPPQLSVIFRALARVDADWLPEPLPPLAPSLEELQAARAARAARRTDADAAAEAEGARVRDSRDTPAQSATGVETEPDADNGPTESQTAAAPAATEPPAEFDPDTLYVAIGATDSTVVYYKLSRGIKKPADIPDE